MTFKELYKKLFEASIKIDKKALTKLDKILKNKAKKKVKSFIIKNQKEYEKDPEDPELEDNLADIIDDTIENSIKELSNEEPIFKNIIVIPKDGFGQGQYHHKSDKIELKIDHAVLYTPYSFFPDFNDTYDDMIDDLLDTLEHELIHREQFYRDKRNIKNIDKPYGEKSYYYRYREMMAYANTLYHTVLPQLNTYYPKTNIKDYLRAPDKFPKVQSRTMNIYRGMSNQARKRFLKYLYQYIEDSE